MLHMFKFNLRIEKIITNKLNNRTTRIVIVIPITCPHLLKNRYRKMKTIYFCKTLFIKMNIETTLQNIRVTFNKEHSHIYYLIYNKVHTNWKYI